MRSLIILSLCAVFVSAQRPVTVALIGYGVDIEHPALKGAIWTNPKEKPANGRDDDKNGWVDDVHGWNFLGPLDRISTEGNREYLRLRDRYKNYTVVVNGVAYGYDEEREEMVELPMPDDMREFEQYMAARIESNIAKVDGARRLARATVKYMRGVDAELRTINGGGEPTFVDFVKWANRGGFSDMEATMNQMVGMMAMSAGAQDWAKMYEYATTRFLEDQGGEPEGGYRLPEESLGDNPYDLDSKGYGNANLNMKNANMGTMQAGIVHEIAPEAKIMVLRVDAGQYDESRQKDVALAIRYAVDKGAKVIQLGRSNTLYPYPGAQWVDDALRYAEKKGVFVVQPVLDLSYDMDLTPFYPHRGELTNFVTVAAADSLGTPLVNANFGRQSLDMFARGVDVESTISANRRAVGTGSYLAAAQVAAAAALIKGKYPKIKPAQMREILMSTVKAPKYEEVEKQYMLNGKPVRDLFLIEDLSVAHGLLDIEKALDKAKNL